MDSMGDLLMGPEPTEQAPPAPPGAQATAATAVAAAPPPVAPPAQPQLRVLDHDTNASIGDLLMGPAAEETKRPASFPSTTPYDVSRMGSEAGLLMSTDKSRPTDYMEQNLLPGRKEQLAFLAPSVWGGANLHGLSDAPLSSAFRLRQLANDRGYDVLFTSGKREGSANDSYHNAGEAIDARIQKIGKDGKRYDLSAKEEVAIGAKLGKVAGWASMLDELNYNVGGTSTGQHLHYSYGIEKNLVNDPSHHLLNNRNVSDPNYLSLNPKLSMLPGTDPNRAGLASQAEAIASANGLDSDVFVRLLQAESDFNINAKSEEGAMGIGQMMPGTITEVAKQLGVSPDTYYNSPNTQMHFAAHYFKKQLEANGGNYARALAGYNAGPQGVKDFISGTHQVYNQTKNYVGKILGITDEQAVSDVVAGTGRTLHPDEVKAKIQEHVDGVKGNVSQIWDAAVGSANSTFNFYSPDFWNTDNPTSGVRQHATWFNTVLHGATAGFFPLLKPTKETYADIEGTVEGEGWGTQQAAKTPGYMAEAIGGIIGWELVGGAVKAIPGISAIPKTVGGMLEGTGLAKSSPMLKAANVLRATAGEATPEIASTIGGPLARFSKGILEQTTTGASYMGIRGAMDYLNSGEPQTPQGLAHAFFANAAFGGLFSGAIAVGLPVAGSLGLNVVGQMAGKPLAQGMANAYGALGTVGKGVTRAVAGAGLGLAAGGMTDMAGLTDEGWKYGASYGAGVGLAVPALAGLLKISGASAAIAKTPAFQAASVWAKEQAAGLVDAQLNTLTQGIVDSFKAHEEINTRLNASDHADIVSKGMDAAMGETTQRRTGVAQQVTEITKQAQQADQRMNQLTQAHAQLEKQFPGAKALLELKDSVEQQEAELMKAKAAPPGAASDSDLSAFSPATQAALGGGKSAPSDPATIARLEQHIKEKQVLIDRDLGDKEVVREVTALGVSRNRIKAAEPVHAQLIASLKEKEAMYQTIDKGHEFASQSQQGVKDTWEGVKTAAQNPNELLTGSYRESLSEVPWNTDGVARRTLNPKTMQEAHKDGTVDFVRAFLEPTVKSGDAFNAKKFSQGLTGDAIDAIGGDSFRAHVSDSLGTLKEDLAKAKEEIDITPPNLHRTSRSGKKDPFVKSTVINWSEETIKGRDVTLANAKTVYDGLLAEMPTIDHAELLKNAELRRQGLQGRRPAPTVYGEHSEAKLNLLADAMAHLDLGETFMPINLGGIPRAKFQQKTLPALHKAGAKARVERMAAEVSHLEDLVNGPMNAPKIDALKSKGDELKAHEYNMYAQGASPREAFNAAQNLKIIQNRYKNVERTAKNLPPTWVEQFSEFIKGGGDLNLAPEEVKNHVLSGKSHADAPASVQAWNDMHTSLQLEEIKRSRWLDSNVQGEGSGGKKLIVSSLRELRAAGLEPDAPKDIKQIIQLINEKVVAVDKGVIRAVNSLISDLANSDKLTPKEISGVAAGRAWRDVVVGRKLASEAIVKEMIEPAFEKHMEEFQTKRGYTMSPKEHETFYREFADGVEDTSKLKAFIEKHGKDVEPFVQTHYALQSMFEFIRKGSPEVYDYARANYFMHRWKKLAANEALAREEGSTPMMSSALASENKRTFSTLIHADEMRAKLRDELEKRGISETEYLNSFDEKRAKMFKYGRDLEGERSWNNLSNKDKQALMKEANDKALLLLADDPVVHPVEIYNAQLSSLWRADGIRQLMRTWHNTSVPTVIEGKTVMQPLMDLSGKGKKLNWVGYKSLAEMDNFKGVKFRGIDGTEHNANQIHLHPEIYKYLADVAGGNDIKAGWLEKGWQKAMNIARGYTLMGTVFPHLKQIATASASEFANSPLKGFNIMGAGKRIISEDIHGGAAMAVAARHGLNIRNFEKNSRVMAESLMQELGPEGSRILYGVGDTKSKQLFQALDFSDPAQKEAQKALGLPGAMIRDTLGVLPGVDHAINREMLFKPIEYGMMGGYHLRVMEYMKENAAKLAELPPAERLRTAQMAAAQTTNLLSGSFADGWANNGTRRAVQNTLLTPTWWMSKAKYMVDAFDSLAYVMAKGAGSKARQSAMERWTSGSTFSQYHPEIRDAMRNRLAGHGMAMLLGGFAMHEAAQYLIDGTFITDHPPDKMLHLHIGGKYYTGPTLGFVKDWMDMARDAVDVGDGSFGFPTFDSLGKAMVNAVAKQMVPPIKSWQEVQAGVGKSAEITPGYTGKAFAVADNLAVASLGGIPDLMGLDSRTATSKDVFNKLTAGVRSKDSTQDTMAKSMSAAQAGMRALGTYESLGHDDAANRSDMENRNKAVMSAARAKLEPYLKKMEEAHLSGDQKSLIEYNQQLMEVWAKGYEVKDKGLLQWHPGGIARVGQTELAARVNRIFNPHAAAMAGTEGTPVGQALLRQKMNYEQNGGSFSDPAATP